MGTMWLWNAGCESNIRDGWCQWNEEQGASSVARKIATVGKMLKQWNIFEFGNVGRQLREAHKELNELRQCPASDDAVRRMNMHA